MDSIFSYGGVQRVTAVIAKELAKDCDVTIVTLDAPSLENTALMKQRFTIAFSLIQRLLDGNCFFARHIAVCIGNASLKTDLLQDYTAIVHFLPKSEKHWLKS